MSAFHDNALIGASGQQGYNISRSVRLRSSASAYFNRTNASSPTNAIKWTWSGWVKRGSLGAQQNLVGATNSGSDDTYFNFNPSDKIVLGSYTGAGTDYGITTVAVFRDPSAWYHVVAVLDTANATSADRAIIYVNGVRQTVTNSASGMWPQNATNNKINTASQVVNIGRRSLGDSYLDGYLTEINFIDGQALTPSSFGETDAVTGVWKPKKYAGTYGTNGFYLNFSDNSATTATTIGKDYSGNGNNWTPNNISVTAGVTYDSMVDSPTVGATSSNYAVMNPLSNGGATISNANLTTTANGATHYITNSTFQMPTSGKWYWEVTSASLASGSRIAAGLLPNGTALSGYAFGNANTYGWYYGDSSNNIYWCSNGSQPFFISGTSGDVLQFCYDADNSTLYAGKNNVFYNSSGSTTGSPSTLTNPTSSSVSAFNAFFPATSVFSSGAFSSNFGQRPFSYTPPTGFKALNTQNLPDPTIKKGNQYFDVSLWTGDATTPRAVVSNLAFSPDLVWTKDRSVGYQHSLQDTVRGTGASKKLYSSLTEAENGANSVYGHINSFDSNGFTVATGSGGAQHVNASGVTYVGWQWKKGATPGFDIVTYTGTGANRTVAHSLGVAPKMIIVKARNLPNSIARPWAVWHTALSSTEVLFLNTTDAKSTGATTYWNSTLPTSSVFSLGTEPVVNGATGTVGEYVAYLFAEVAGFSRFGSYTGNGSSDGVFVHLGFRARYLLIKETGNANSWEVYDTARNTSNVQTKRLFPNDSLAEATTDPSLDILSNGFKCRAGNTGINRSGGTYIFAAFAENPMKFSLAR